MNRLVRVFTHPACSGCSAAVKMAWEITETLEDVELKTVALETKDGLAEAHLEKIKTIPSLIISEGKEELRRFIGSPTAQELKQAILETYVLNT